MNLYKIGIVGGTGNEGGGLAVRLAWAGHQVTIGSRNRDRAEKAVKRYSEETRKPIGAADNREAVLASDIVILTVPFAAQLSTLENVKEELQGRILIDTTVPLVPPRVSRVQLPEKGSAVLMAQTLLSQGVRVVSAFQNLSAYHLHDLSHPVETDVIVCGDNQEACDIVIDIARSMRVRGIYGGPLCNSAATEALTSVLIAINRRYKVVASGIQITGLPASVIET